MILIGPLVTELITYIGFYLHSATRCSVALAHEVALTAGLFMRWLWLYMQPPATKNRLLITPRHPILHHKNAWRAHQQVRVTPAEPKAPPVSMQDVRADADAAASGHRDAPGSSSRPSSRAPAFVAQNQLEQQHARENAAAFSSKPQRHVSFSEFVHERIFSVVPASPAPELNGGSFTGSNQLISSSSSDGDSNANDGSSSLDEMSVIVGLSAASVDGAPTLSQQQQEGMSAMLHSKIRLPPPPSPPDSPPRQAAPSSALKAAGSTSPLRAHGGGGIAKTTFESILTGISEGSAPARDAGGESVTEKELRLSHERIADSLRERLLCISQRMRDINVLEACHPAGALPSQPCPTLTYPTLI